MKLDEGRRTTLTDWTHFTLDREVDHVLFNDAAWPVATRRGREWLFQKTTKMPSQELHEWLIQNIGDEYGSYWEHDRYFFTDDLEQLPDIKGDWRETAAIVPEDRRNWIWYVETPCIGFRNPDHAMLFKLRWAP